MAPGAFSSMCSGPQDRDLFDGRLPLRYSSPPEGNAIMSITKRIDRAREAFKRRDRDASRAAHAPEAFAAHEHHGGAEQQYLGEVVYGGLDGIVTTFAIVSGVAGAELGAGVVLILGLANLFADGLSMATGAYLSSKAESERYDEERRRELWEIDNYPEGERAELVDLYQRQGYSLEDAQSITRVLTQDRERWADVMMAQELELLREDRNPLLIGAATLAAFVAAGSLPLLVYLVDLVRPLGSSTTLAVSIVLSALALFGLGAAKVRVTGRNWLRSGLEMLVVGGLAAGVAYLIGYLLRGLGVSA
ncbi:MAG: VIT1/CCC1 transporter family protein [Anaerolineae bacterium]